MAQPDCNWPLLFREIKKLTKGAPLPYVTRLSQRITGKQRAFLVLVATVISLRTKDQTTEDATERLIKMASSPQEMQSLTVKQIEKAIYPCGFFRNKAKQIKNFSKIIVKDFDGNVPQDLETLIRFPGVGRKTANLVLTEGFDHYGICVDIHVHRILNRLGWIKSKDPDQTELILRDKLPKRYWKTLNFWLVMFGQFHCKPVSPRCQECSLKSLCAYGAKRP